MTTYKITLEVQLKEATLYRDDFIYRAIEEQLESHEQIMDYDIEEVTA